ncbi:TSCPD domain-containing protein [Clostridium polyendosporum]|uniref:ribonucleoside-diphosphate reductase n=1 Tax=Clostridium polyendosporum TaxID=69208 RepID=A0A919VLJ7_9CLOT|nr:TIGR03905 family TSCPD domain-containing protein [Clostridium polyendosporum]GIM28668.1 TSCPD domain-containing protein [Clostridium polyendosporum]
MYSFKTTGVCSKQIDFQVINNKVKNVSFTAGCSGNLKGLSALIEGMEINDAINRLKGITCGNRETSCPDQLSKALEQYINKQC